MCHGDEDPQTPLLGSSSSSYESFEESFKRTGTAWSAVAHIITGVIGAGVLSLAWSVAQLGWVAGPLSIIVFAAITTVTTRLICDCYRSPDPELGLTRHRSLTGAVHFYLGDRSSQVCGLFVHEILYGTGIAYNITAASSMRAIHMSNCYPKDGNGVSCAYGNSFYVMLFGAAQIVMSQIPDFHNMEWLSAIAAIMSFSYAFIGMALGFTKVIENGGIKGGIWGVPADTTTQKLWVVFQALGDVAFAYPYSMILLEIQDTLKSPPSENKTMKKASTAAIFITTSFYLCCGCLGYAAFGSLTPGNLLAGFGFYKPYWLIDLANACIALHLVGGYQVYSQPVFAFVERWSAKKFPSSGFINNFYRVKLPGLPALQINLLRVFFRTTYVASTTGIAIIFPYFNEFLGVLGALNFWPLSIYFPVKMYFAQKNIRKWTKQWIVLQALSVICLIVTTVALVGSVEGLIKAKFSKETKLA